MPDPGLLSSASGSTALRSAVPCLPRFNRGAALPAHRTQPAANDCAASRRVKSEKGHLQGADGNEGPRRQGIVRCPGKTRPRLRVRTRVRRTFTHLPNHRLEEKSGEKEELCPPGSRFLIHRGSGEPLCLHSQGRKWQEKLCLSPSTKEEGGTRGAPTAYHCQPLKESRYHTVIPRADGAGSES